MSDYENQTGSASLLKQKLFEALRSSVASTEEGRVEVQVSRETVSVELSTEPAEETSQAVYDFLMEESPESASSIDLPKDDDRLDGEHYMASWESEGAQSGETHKTELDDKLTLRGVVPDAQTEAYHPAGAPSSSFQANNVKSDSSNSSGGSMADLSGYKDLSKAPISFGDEDMPVSLTPDLGYERNQYQQPQQQHQHQQQFSAAQHFAQDVAPQEVDTEFSGNVKTLIRLVNELPEGVTKQTGAQIIRLTMEAMGISMEDVLSEAQSAQSEMLDAVRANIKKIEEYKTVIRKLETDIKYYQGKANELSEIIDLFILSNTSGNKMAMPEDLNH